ncbi:hypothetical protein HG536_0B01970 [Torulaspora globosa]|uniref:Uncharacterized protein n=1 Tax=Torulaspora globosa TaxID=48254 RepID=A0A7G3ZCU8_9SACH|nr:uncharacterized protein HG536_0B01970 [Torulaspora globosa]QLL31334.1 hypothetical protein HG536_0B01970 [Torulaspora globosa]
MNEDQRYKDPIVSLFCKTDVKGKLDEDAIRSWIAQQSQSDEDIKNCAEALEIYTDLLKLEFYIAKSWDIRTLVQSVAVKFELAETNLDSKVDQDHDDSFYRDIALKCIHDCDKLSNGLQKKQSRLDEIRRYLSSKRETILEDSSTFLLELWFTCRQELCLMRDRVAAVFIRSKALMIDHELESFEHRLSDTTILSSYRSFMKILIEQLQDSEISSDQSLFSECLQVFLDIEAMYNALNFNLLLDDNESLQDSLMVCSQSETNLDSSYNGQESSRWSLPSRNPLNDHSRTSSLSGSSSFSMMMDRTNLAKELPSLLTAFNNAKKMEQEIESVRTTPLGAQLPHITSHHEQQFTPSNLFRSKLYMMNQQQDCLRSFISSAGNSHSVNNGSDIAKSLCKTGNGSSRR